MKWVVTVLLIASACLELPSGFASYSCYFGAECPDGAECVAISYFDEPEVPPLRCLYRCNVEDVCPSGSVCVDEQLCARTPRSILHFNLNLSDIDDPWFPLLVRLTRERADLSLIGEPEPDFGPFLNLEFHDALGTELVYEVESFTSEELIAWVRVPSVGAGTTSIVVDYGPEIGTSYHNRDAAWSKAYATVHHFSSQFFQDLSDSTANTNNGVVFGNASPSVGLIGQGYGFALDGAIEIGAPDLHAFTISGWFKWSGAETNEQALISRQNTLDGGSDFWIGGISDRYGIRVTTKGGNLSGVATTTLMDGWVHLAMTAGESGESGVKLYVNGELELAHTAEVQPANRSPIYIGAAGGISPDTDFLAGWVDEVRIETVERSADWIRAQYLSMADQLITYERIR